MIQVILYGTLRYNISCTVVRIMISIYSTTFEMGPPNIKIEIKTISKF